MHTNRQPRPILRRLLALAAAGVLVISCDLSTLVPAPVPTPLPPGAINTIIAQTAGAAASETATLLPPTLTPTFTPTSTRTPTQTPSPTSTFIFLLASPTRTATPGTSPSDFACNLVDQSPADDSNMGKNVSFYATWKVKNIGQATWIKSNVDFVYQNGDKLATVKSTDLPQNTMPGETVVLKVPMVSPMAANTYKTVWTLREGKNSFCRLSLTIVVGK